MTVLGSRTHSEGYGGDKRHETANSLAHQLQNVPTGHTHHRYFFTIYIYGHPV